MCGGHARRAHGDEPTQVPARWRVVRPRGWAGRPVFGDHRRMGRRLYRQPPRDTGGNTMSTRELLDPTAERTPARRERTPRPPTLDGLTVGLLDIAKARGDVFLDRIDALVTARGLRVARFRKPTFAKVLPAELADQISSRCHVVVEALAD